MVSPAVSDADRTAVAFDEPAELSAMVGVPSVIEAIEAPDDVAAWAVAHGPTDATLLPLLTAVRTGRLSLEGRVDALTALERSRAMVEAAVLPLAASQTVGEFGKAAERAALTVDGSTAVQRHELARKDRRVAFRAVADGMCELWALLPLDQAAAAKVAIDSLASTVHVGDPRTADQRRADVACDLLTRRLTSPSGANESAETDAGSCAACSAGEIDLPKEQGMKPTVLVTGSIATLAGASDAPGELAGFGPIPAFLVRRIAADPSGTWRRLTTDDHGQLLDYGRTTYRPPADLARYVIARDRTCCFPGCTRAAARCELDHCRDWAVGGTTSADNIYALCARHHHLKHETNWTYEPLPDGDLEWTSPTGHTYVRKRRVYPDENYFPEPPRRRSTYQPPPLPDYPPF